MNGDAVKEIERIVEEGNKVIEIDGVNYSRNRLNRVFANIYPASIDISTLSGLAAYLNDNVDCLKKEDLTILVESYASLRVISSLDGEKNRSVYIRVHLDETLKTFPFERFLNHEDFIIKLRSMFVSSEPDSVFLQSFVSRLAINDSIEAADDGVAQNVTVKKGISGVLKEVVDSKPIVELRPFRTFREISQPKSEFLFRMRQNGSIPECALFEADGGAWKIAAVESIAEWISQNIRDVKVIK